MAKATYKVTGNTIGRKDKIRKAGGKWDAVNKCWVVDLYGSDTLFKWSDLVFTKIESEEKSNAQKEKEYDDLHNEGGEGFNPYR